MKNINNIIMRNSTVITDKLYYLLPLELLLSFLLSLSLAGIWNINQVSTIISWDAWRQIRDVFQMSEAMLLQAIIFVIIIYLSTHIFICYIWIKEDKLSKAHRAIWGCRANYLQSARCVYLRMQAVNIRCPRQGFRGGA